MSIVEYDSPKCYFILMKSTEILTSFVEEVIEKESLETKLKSGRKLIIKLGADPTAPDLHLGHALVLRKLKEFQDLGHKAVFIIGDYTAKIGDPSGRAKARPPMTKKEIEKNSKTYFDQASTIIDLKKADIRYNSEWFSKLSLENFIRVASNFSSQRIMDREDFKKRIEAGEEVVYSETIYQVMQAYDSVAVKADIEIGGRDQRLNLLAGRELQKKMGLPEQDLIILPLLIGIDGKEKMSKSLGNYIALNDSADNMFGKMMSIPDSLIAHYYEFAAFSRKSEIELVKNKLKKENPRDIKLDLAELATSLYKGKAAGKSARKGFLNLFSKKDYSGGLPKVGVRRGERKILDFLVDAGAASSKSEARRLVLGGAVEVGGRIVKSPDDLVEVETGTRVRVGKKKFFEVK